MVSPSDFGKKPKNPALKKIEYEHVDFRKFAEEERLLKAASEKSVVIVQQKCAYCGIIFDRFEENATQVTCSSACKRKYKRLQAPSHAAQAPIIELKKFSLKTNQRLVVTQQCIICSASFKKYIMDEEHVACSSSCRNKVKKMRLSGAMPLTEQDAIQAERDNAEVAEKLRLHEEIMATMYRDISEKKFTPRTTEENLRKVRQWQEKANEFDFLCPRPLKKVYRTWEEAEAFILEKHPDDNYIHPYICRCAAIHIGHSNGYGSPRETEK